MNPLLQAEQAVLGAALLNPDQLVHLDWLEPAHFYRPVHRALFAAMRKLRNDGHPALSAEGDTPLSWVTDAVREASRHVRGLTASYAHTLVAACPRPGHAPVYGRMVLEGAIHRTVAQHAVRLHQAARADALQGEVEGALHQADVLAGVLADLARRWGTDARPVAPVTASAPHSAEPALGRSDRVAEDEQFLLAILVDQPVAMEEVADWLRPADFADVAHGQLYHCLGALHHRGEPIDRLTVLWEAQRRGLIADGTVAEETISTVLAGLGAGSAEYLGEQIIRSSLVRTAAASARAIRSLTEDTTFSAGRLINHALHALGPLDDVRTRWQIAVKPPPPEPRAPTVNAPPAARVEAALARSQPRYPNQAAQRSTPTAGPHGSRTPARSH